jgi:hypothetical protein
MMNVLKLSLIVTSAVLVTGTLCFAADPTVTGTKTEQVNSDAVPELEDVEMVEINTIKPMAPKYPFGEPIIKEDTAKSVWIATLPGRGIKIQSQWTSEPTFEQNAGVAALGSMQMPTSNDQGTPVISQLFYVYTPEALKFDIKNPASIVGKVIDEPVKIAREAGKNIKVSTISGKKASGVVEDTRRKVTIVENTEDADGNATAGETEQVQYFRLLIGKDYIIFSLVAGGPDLSEKDAQKFLDNISIEPAQAR